MTWLKYGLEQALNFLWQVFSMKIYIFLSKASFAMDAPESMYNVPTDYLNSIFPLFPPENRTPIPLFLSGKTLCKNVSLQILNSVSVN